MLWCRLHSRRHDTVHDEELTIHGNRPPTIREDLDTVLVVPIVNDTFEEVRIGSAGY